MKHRPLAPRLFAVVVEDRRRGTIDRVLLYAAGTQREAARMARGLYRTDETPPARHRFSAQPITEVSGPGGAPYRVLVHRIAGPP